MKAKAQKIIKAVKKATATTQGHESWCTDPGGHFGKCRGKRS